MTLELNRRSFIVGSGSMTVSLLMPNQKASAAATRESRFPLQPDQLASYITVNDDGSAVGWVGKVDMGQGTEIGWVQMIAEELDLPVDRVRVVQGDTNVTINMGGASGSTGVRNGGVALRAAAAEARRLLLDMASDRLGVAVDGLSVKDGVIMVASDETKKVSFGDLMGGRYFDQVLEWNKVIGSDLKIKGIAKPKDPSTYKIVGKSGYRRRDVADKVLGHLEYMVDVKVPDMLHGRMIRPPVAGAIPTAVDETSVAGIPGVQVVWQKGFLGVVAPKEWHAIKAAEALKVTWSDVEPPFSGVDKLHDHIRTAPIAKHIVEKEKGDVSGAISSGARIIEASYEWPFQSHANMGPACGVADVRADKAYVWSGTQKPHYCRDGIAKYLGFKPEQVEVRSVTGPGSYGRNDSGDACMDAAVLSKAVGRPVRVQGMRRDGTTWDPKAPASVHTSRAAIDADGRVTAWYFESKVFSRQDVSSHESDPAFTLAGQLLGVKLKPDLVFGAPFNNYGFDAFQFVSNIVAPMLDRASPLRTSHMRDPGGPQIHFAVESFMDELAYALSLDPVEFRLRYITDPRDVELIKATTAKAGWVPHSAARKHSTDDVYYGQGLAYALHDAGTRVVSVADVEINKKTGHLWVRKMTVGQDCGQIVNPDLVKMAVEGNVCQSISRATFEEVRFDQKSVTSVDWVTYPILRIQEAPETIDVLLLDRPEIAPTGSGEAASRPTAAAIANAIFDATGVRIRKAPLTSERILAALSKQPV